MLRGDAFATGTAAAACKDCTSGSELFVDAPDEFGAFPGSVENLISIASGATETVKGPPPLCGTLATCGAVLFDGFGGPSDGKAGVADREKGVRAEGQSPVRLPEAVHRRRLEQHASGHGCVRLVAHVPLLPGRERTGQMYAVGSRARREPVRLPRARCLLAHGTVSVECW